MQSVNHIPPHKLPIDALSRPIRDLRISVIDQCNFRCSYCMPAEVFRPDYVFLERDQLLSFEEIERLARLFSKLGMHKVRLTGGEPLLRRDLYLLVRSLKSIEGVDDVALTTNGVILAKCAGRLKSAGLDRVTVSLDALSRRLFGEMNGRNISVERVLEGIEAAAAVGLPVKINMVVKKGQNESEILPMARFMREQGHTLRFIEFMDVGNHNGWKMEHVFPSREIVKIIAQEMPLEPLEANYTGEVAQRYRYRGSAVEIGLISSVTHPFCADCTRARLSADGLLYTCLFANQGWDLKEMLRGGDSDELILETLIEIWTNRTDRYSERRTELLRRHLHPLKVEMSYIGG